MSKLRSTSLHICLGLLTLATASLSSAQTIFSVTESATPDQPIVLAGDAFDPATQVTLRPYDRYGNLGAAQNLTVKSQTAMSIGTQIPSTLGLGVYRVEAKSLLGTGDSVLVNAPRVTWVNELVVAPGSATRLIGRNFKPVATIAPTVRFVDTATGQSYAASVYKSTNYDVSFYAPQNVVVGRTYKVLVNNNLAGSVSETEAPTTVSVKAAGSDPFSLGVPWGSEFDAISKNVINIKTDSRLSVKAKGDGVTNDARALQAAVQLAYNTGGGTVYLPAGTYNVDDGTSVFIPWKVVLKGDGGSSALRVGYRYTPTVAPSNVYPLSFFAGNNSGLFNLAIVNANTNAAPNFVLRYQSTAAQPMSHTFIRYVKFVMGNAKPLNLSAMRGAVIAGNNISNTAMGSGPVNLDGSRDLLFFNNIVNWKCGRLRMNMSSRNVVEKNTLQVDNTDYGNKDINGNPTETGGFETSFSQNILMANNTFQGYGKGDNKVECEFIMNQRSIVKDYWAAGLVVSATPTTLTQLKNWSGSWQAVNYDNLERSYVAITKGKGAGQIRRVVSHDTNSLVVDQPWEVVPDVTSVYAVGSFTSLDQTIIGNTMSQFHCGIMFWNGGVDNVTANNTLTDSGFIMVRSDSQPDTRGLGTLSQDIAWHNIVADNNVSTTTSRYMATISLSANITKPAATFGLMGNLALNNTIRGNTISGSNAFHDFNLFRYDGIEVLNYNEASMPLDPLVNLGYNVSGNTITGSLQPYRYFGLF